MRNTIPVLALVVSLISVTLSIIACSRADTRAQAAETRALAAVRDREARFLEWLTPKINNVIREFDVPAYPDSPQTLEEALTPLFSLIESVKGSLP